MLYHFGKLNTINMKKLLILLLLPLFSFSQTFDDLMGIDSEETFVKTMIEIGFERIDTEEDVTTYAYNPTYEDGQETKSSLWVYHTPIEQGGVIFLQIMTKDFFGSESNSEYTKIFDIAKEKCEYAELVPNEFVEGDQMVMYACEMDSNPSGIAFSKKDGTGYISYTYFNKGAFEN